MAAAASTSSASLTVVTTLDEGGREIAAVSPSLIFVQSRISGFSAEILARHVKNQVGEKSAMIILLTEAADARVETLADAVLDSSIRDDDLQTAILEIISARQAALHDISESSRPAPTTGKKKKTAARTAAADPDTAKKPPARKTGGKKEKAEAKARIHEELDAMFGTFQEELASILGKPAASPPAASLPPEQKKKPAYAELQEELAFVSTGVVPSVVPPASIEAPAQPGRPDGPVSETVNEQGASAATGAKPPRNKPLSAESSSFPPEGCGPAEPPAAMPDCCLDISVADPAGARPAPSPAFVPDAGHGHTESVNGIEKPERPSGHRSVRSEQDLSVSSRQTEEVTDTVSVGGTASSAVRAPEKGAPSALFEHELNTLLGTAAGTPSRPAVAKEDTGRFGPTVDEMFLRTPPPVRRNRLAAPLLCLAALAVAAFIYYSGGTRHTPADKAARPPASTSSVKQPASSPPAPQVAKPGEAAPGLPAETKPPPAESGSHKAQGLPASSQPPHSPAPAATAPSPPSQPAAQVVRSALPGFIPSKAEVKGYGVSNPGWEKYVTPTVEFRIYREKSSIKAIQAIDLSGKGIPRTFFTKAIEEVAGVRDYRLESKETKGEYLIKKGKLSGNARLILYKKNADTLLQAFVIYFQ